MKYPNKFLLAVILVGVAVLVWMFARTKPVPDFSLIGTDARAIRIERNGEATDAAEVSFSFARKTNDYTLANVAIDLNKDGRIAPYETEDGATQEEWIVRNMRAKVIEAGNAYSFDLVDRSADDGSDFRLTAMLTAEPVGDWNGATPRQPSAYLETTISAFEVEDFGGLIDIGDPNGTGGGPEDGAPASLAPANSQTPFSDAEKWLRDTTVPEGRGTGAGEAAAAIGGEPAPLSGPMAGADFEAFQADVPDMLQGVNECVPTSTSNAIHWLAKRYGFEDRIPEDQSDTMNELKPDMNWRRADGVDVGADFLSGKVAFTRRHDLPIYTHQIGTSFDPQIVRKIADELAKGQAVELVIGYYRRNDAGEWIRNGGHMVSVAGAWGANGQTYLGVHDPVSPEVGRLDVYEVGGEGRMFNYRYRGRSATFIEFAFAESPTEEWVGAHPPSTEIETFGGVGETEDVSATWFVQMLKIGTAWYPVAQFHKFTGPECDQAEHWHANTGTAWGLEFRNQVDFNYTPAEVTDRRLTSVMWTDTVDCGAGKTAQVPVRNILVSAQEAFDLAGKIVP